MQARRNNWNITLSLDPHDDAEHLLWRFTAANIFAITHSPLNRILARAKLKGEKGKQKNRKEKEER